MAAPSANATLVLPAKVYTGVINPVSNPGTALGLVAAIRERRRQRRRHVRCREWGGGIGTTIECGDDIWLSLILRGVDGDALSAVFAGVVTGASGDKGLRDGVNVRAGVDLEQSARATTLLVKPEDTTKRGLIYYRAIPLIAEPIEDEGETELLFAGTEEQTWQAGFLAVRDSQGRRREWLRPSDMTVP